MKLENILIHEISNLKIKNVENLLEELRKPAFETAKIELETLNNSLKLKVFQNLRILSHGI